MKLYIVLLLSLFAGMFTANAQSPAPASVSTDIARSSTDQLVAKYKLNADQAKQMYQIQVRKQKNMAEIAVLKGSNNALYREKVQHVQSGTLSSIRRILKTKEQVELYAKTQREVRSNRAAKRKELTVKKSSKEEIEDALLEVYSE
ncbi:MAG: hypothetical protein WCR52_21635 [Bacteroidota bacterium]